ncbi:uncharacterized protein BT62DRAFT_1004966 [Guyanagaster necrorhizus]|uniref:Uncharacterized protein n=1 Tax=Guyanagaster necrorhizus TaxID=856835 RepID=A0A9P8ATF6_9AGAR|nr:uncharacterized protein BT62DRAFT_1004966 [Guyanagaster necrorhizus MCA 3950]KAG7447364.1 hypothetical protein BT62DRAFT_1004966 [Guyanagaster necrorhizus MCA 3950]
MPAEFTEISKSSYELNRGGGTAVDDTCKATLCCLFRSSHIQDPVYIYARLDVEPNRQPCRQVDICSFAFQMPERERGPLLHTDVPMSAPTVACHVPDPLRNNSLSQLTASEVPDCGITGSHKDNSEACSTSTSSAELSDQEYEAVGCSEGGCTKSFSEKDGRLRGILNVVDENLQNKLNVDALIPEYEALSSAVDVCQPGWLLYVGVAYEETDQSRNENQRKARYSPYALVHNGDGIWEGTIEMETAGSMSESSPDRHPDTNTPFTATVTTTTNQFVYPFLIISPGICDMRKGSVHHHHPPLIPHISLFLHLQVSSSPSNQLQMVPWLQRGHKTVTEKLASSGVAQKVVELQFATRQGVTSCEMQPVSVAESSPFNVEIMEDAIGAKDSKQPDNEKQICSTTELGLASTKSQGEDHRTKILKKAKVILLSRLNDIMA